MPHNQIAENQKAQKAWAAEKLKAKRYLIKSAQGQQRIKDENVLQVRDPKRTKFVYNEYVLVEYYHMTSIRRGLQISLSYIRTT